MSDINEKQISVSRNERLNTMMNGKTIATVEAVACNWMKITFTDESSIEFEVEYIGSNLYGMTYKFLANSPKGDGSYL